MLPAVSVERKGSSGFSLALLGAAQNMPTVGPTDVGTNTLIGAHVLDVLHFIDMAVNAFTPPSPG